jgi:hypothetical protein
MLASDSSCSVCREISCESAEVGLTKTNQNRRTEFAQSGGLEAIGRRERISGPGGSVAVQRFPREARGYWRFQRAKTPRRMLDAEGLAEGEKLGSNGLLICKAPLALATGAVIQIASFFAFSSGPLVFQELTFPETQPFVRQSVHVSQPST